MPPKSDMTTTEMIGRVNAYRLLPPHHPVRLSAGLLGGVLAELIHYRQAEQDATEDRRTPGPELPMGRRDRSGG